MGTASYTALTIYVIQCCLRADVAACCWQNGVKIIWICRPLAPGTYNVSAVLKGYSTVSAEIRVPKNGSGVVYNFTLPCTTCNSVYGSAGWDTLYNEQVKSHNIFLQLGILSSLPLSALFVMSSLAHSLVTEGVVRLHNGACREIICGQLYMPF